MEEVVAQMQQMMQQQQAMQAQLQTLIAENQQLRNAASTSAGSASTASIDALVAALQEQNRIAASKSKPSIIDSRGIGKPAQFDNKEQHFSIWSKKLENFCLSAHPNMQPVLDLGPNPWSTAQ